MNRPLNWLRPFHHMVWADPHRRARKLLQFGEVEADGARDLFRASELTRDPRLRRRLFAHARDEVRHANLFRARGSALRWTLPQAPAAHGLADIMVPGESGLDDLNIEHESAASLLAFIHLAESAAFRAFTAYGDVLGKDPETRAVIGGIAKDERGHMRYSLEELRRVTEGRPARALWIARGRRLWRAYLRFAAALADRIALVLLVAQYFLLLAPFAWLARRAAAREPSGWQPVPAETTGGRRQY